jgi:transcription elongation factor Elf1
MAGETEKDADLGVDIKATDIVFDCPHCGKSLAIDYRGAGLVIQCSDCGNDVQVPIPDGVELADIDSSVEEQEARILNLRRSLHAAEARIVALESSVETISARDDEARRLRAAGQFREGAFLEKASTMRSHLQDALTQLDAILAISLLPDESDSGEPDVRSDVRVAD